MITSSASDEFKKLRIRHDLLARTYQSTSLTKCLDKVSAALNDMPIFISDSHLASSPEERGRVMEIRSKLRQSLRTALLHTCNALYDEEEHIETF